MFYSTTIILITALLSTAVKAHISLAKPLPISHKNNPNTVGEPDYNYLSPLAPDGSNFPCKGYHKLFDAPGGASVETWAAGSTQTWSTLGSATHNGGSCQLSISEDVGVTFKVIKTYIGNCPVAGKQYSFTVPKDAKSGKVLFAWSWINHTGNSEMYMNCASVTITDGGAGLSAYPEIFKANIGNGCSSVASAAVIIPNPGADVETDNSGILAAPIGECGASAPAPAPAPAASGTSAESTPVATSSVTAPSTSAAEGCMCTCGGPNGYIVNISPAGSVAAMAQMGSRTATTTTLVKATVSTSAAGSHRRHRRWNN